MALTHFLVCQDWGQISSVLVTSGGKVSLWMTTEKVGWGFIIIDCIIMLTENRLYH